MFCSCDEFRMVNVTLKGVRAIPVRVGDGSTCINDVLFFDLVSGWNNSQTPSRMGTQEIWFWKLGKAAISVKVIAFDNRITFHF